MPPVTSGQAKQKMLEELLRRNGQGSALRSAAELTRPSPPRLLSTAPVNLLPLLRGGALADVTGDWASGKTSWVLTAAAQLSQQGQLIALVDAPGRLYPPALAQLGLLLQNVLFLHPPAERLIWATEQVLLSGLFGLAVLLEPPPLSAAAFRRLQLAAERGNTAMCLTRQPFPGTRWTAWQMVVQAAPPQLRTPPLVPLAAPPRRQKIQLLRQGGLPPAETTPIRRVVGA